MNSNNSQVSTLRCSSILRPHFSGKKSGRVDKIQDYASINHRRSQTLLDLRGNRAFTNGFETILTVVG